MTKVNKEYVERTSATTKYADKQAYVAGEAEHSQVHKVNDVDQNILKSAKKADLMSELKNINIKMAFEDHQLGSSLGTNHLNDVSLKF